jgi:hypothetical protein
MLLSSDILTDQASKPSGSATRSQPAGRGVQCQDPIGDRAGKHGIRGHCDDCDPTPRGDLADALAERDSLVSID